VLKTSHPSGKPSGRRKAWMQGSNTLAGGKTFAKRGNKNNLTRNAIGQLSKRAGADRNDHPVKQPEPPAVDGIRSASTNPAGPGVMAIIVPTAHPKPSVPLAGSVGRPHDPPAGATPLLAGLDGHGMIHLGGRTAAIGGGANLNTGVLNASDFHPKVR
jgi:hypothetical protein